MDIEDSDHRSLDGTEIDRSDTLLRILYSVLFALGLGVLEGVIYVLVAFQLGYTLVTESPPPERVGEVQNRLLSYYYQVLRYLTHNDPERPFPFSDFPPEVEPPRLEP